jgi:hypothetical protein
MINHDKFIECVDLVKLRELVGDMDLERKVSINLGKIMDVHVSVLFHYDPNDEDHVKRNYEIEKCLEGLL